MISIIVGYFQVCLVKAFRHRNFDDFVYALEFLNADVNQQQDSGLSVFQEILQTPSSAEYIKAAISNGADCYSVNNFNSKYL